MRVWQLEYITHRGPSFQQVQNTLYCRYMCNIQDFIFYFRTIVVLQFLWIANRNKWIGGLGSAIIVLKGNERKKMTVNTLLFVRVALLHTVQYVNLCLQVVRGQKNRLASCLILVVLVKLKKSNITPTIQETSRANLEAELSFNKCFL